MDITQIIIGLGLVAIVGTICVQYMARGDARARKLESVRRQLADIELQNARMEQERQKQAEAQNPDNPQSLSDQPKQDT